ncbi:MAG: glycolate oxidase subunit GlcF [Alphaproteobacteria bacterium]
MQTNFSLAQLADPGLREVDAILRKCVHCGFCTATCPTYVLLGDELDSPRGRIYLIKDMLENARPASAEVTTHIDRCLSCLACVTTCPSGVDYTRLIDHARVHVETTYRRPWPERFLRALLARVLPDPALFRLALAAARPVRPLARLLPGRLATLLAMAPARVPGRSPVDRPQTFQPQTARRMRVALLTGCAQQVLGPAINEATVRLLTRLGCEVVVQPGTGCCGALVHHLGRADAARRQAIANVAALSAALDDGGLDAVVSNASGCGTMVKDYGHLLGDDPEWCEKAARVAGLARDVSELLADLDVRAAADEARPVVAYHAACSLQHGQQIRDQPKQVLAACGFELRDVAEGHLCCGSAGTYNLLQPALATRLRDRKVANIERTGAEVIAAGNIGCIVQIAAGTSIPVVHPVELVDWATGGPKPAALAARR